MNFVISYKYLFSLSLLFFFFFFFFFFLFRFFLFKALLSKSINALSEEKIIKIHNEIECIYDFYLSTGYFKNNFNSFSHDKEIYDYCS
jgi:hypothetical protein